MKIRIFYHIWTDREILGLNF